ncbi:AAA family ATPase [Trichocoleus desertorum AS-A10]|uniref:AAA family ATPase n=1 Tax=Trichocoleus desertorum TaxID=1481672 RepID=UPI00329700EF
MSDNNDNLTELLSLLKRLDPLLEYAIAAAQSAFDLNSASDAERRLDVNTEVDRLLTREPGAPNFQGYVESDEPIPAIAIDSGSRLDWLQRTFKLDKFDLDVVAIALAPELDRRYERLYAYLQDDVRCKRPSVDLALNLLCSTAIDKLTRRVHFAPDAPLVCHELLHLMLDPNQSKSTLLMHELHLDEQVVRFLLDQPGLDSQLAGWCQLMAAQVRLQDLLLPTELKRSLTKLVKQKWALEQPLRLYFEGSDRPGKRQTAEALAKMLKIPLLVVDLPRMLNVKVEFASMLQRVFRESWFQKALLYFDGFDILQTDEQAIANQSLLAQLADSHGITIVASQQSWVPSASKPLGIITISFPMPDFAQRQRYWQRYLKLADLKLDQVDLEAIAARFRLTSTQIAEAVATAVHNSQFKNQKLTTSDLFSTARAQSGHDLGTLARKMEARYTWDDIVLRPDQLTQLQELCNQAKYRQLVYEEWGFEQKLSLGKGVNALFSGLPGTGKTMAAEVIANELQLDLYRIDLSQIVSKYIGETEKNLDRIFTAAASSNAILLFDEADALFGKRSEVQDAHDRYANIEVGYLLQKMEEYEGIAILTTNLRSSIDDAFVRRLQFIIDFPLPNQQERFQIWQQVWPQKLPKQEDLDFELLARQFEITGACIRNIALAAAFLAASDGKVVTLNHITRATQREYQKTGKLFLEKL